MIEFESCNWHSTGLCNRVPLQSYARSQCICSFTSRPKWSNRFAWRWLSILWYNIWKLALSYLIHTCNLELVQGARSEVLNHNEMLVVSKNFLKKYKIQLIPGIIVNFVRSYWKLCLWNYWLVPSQSKWVQIIFRKWFCGKWNLFWQGSCIKYRNLRIKTIFQVFADWSNTESILKRRIKFSCLVSQCCSTEYILPIFNVSKANSFNFINF